MGWPQIAVIALLGMDFGASVMMHGKPRQPYNMWATALGIGITTWLLLAGGFWQ